MFAMKTATTWLQLLLCLCFLVSIYASSSSMKEDEDMYNVRANDADSAQSRAMATLNVTTTMPSNPRIISRRNFPSKKNNNNPHVCLAFLSCCGRTDLLNHTLAGGTLVFLEKYIHLISLCDFSFMCSSHPHILVK